MPAKTRTTNQTMAGDIIYRNRLWMEYRSIHHIHMHPCKMYGNCGKKLKQWYPVKPTKKKIWLKTKIGNAVAMVEAN